MPLLNIFGFLYFTIVLFIVYNVSALPLDQSKTEKVLQHLSPGQEYEAWIRAMTAAGPGEKTTLRFKTKHQEYFGMTFNSVPVQFVPCTS